MRNHPCFLLLAVAASACGGSDAAAPAPATLYEPETDDTAECRATQIGSGSSHVCALRSDGAVVCWGDFLSVGSCAPSGAGAPAEVDGLASATALSSMERAHSCAVRDAGTLACWGWNGHRQIGSGSITEYVVTPAEVVDGEGHLFGAVSRVASGGGQTCAIREDALHCWGYNVDGVLGAGVEAAVVPHPAAIAPLHDVREVAAGNSHLCAIQADRTLACWGWNGAGQVGNGTLADVLEPTVVLDDVTAVAAGMLHTCAIDGGGRIWCWGYNASGQLGDGTTSDRPSPVAIEAPFSARAIAVGENHSCAVDEDGGLWCWGANWYGQLGMGSFSDAPVRTPTRAEAVTEPVSAVAVGEVHSCALTVSGTVLCFGSNDQGEIGNGEPSTGGVARPFRIDVCAAAKPIPAAECPWIPYPEPDDPPPAPTWPDGTEVLASGLHLPIALAVSDEDVYFVTFGSLPPDAAGALSKVPKIGGETTVIAPNRRRPVALALAGAKLVWAEQGLDPSGGAVWSCGASGELPAELASSPEPPVALAVHAGAAYWLTHDLSGAVRSVPTSGGAVSLLSSGWPLAYGLAVDTSGVYLTASNPAVVRTDLDGGGATVLVPGAASPGPLALSETAVFWTTIDALASSVGRVEKSGGPVLTLADDSGKKLAIATDATHVWWSSGKALLKAPLAGAPATEVLIAPKAIDAIALDEAHVFVAAGSVDGEIVKVPK